MDRGKRGKKDKKNKTMTSDAIIKSSGLSS